MRAPSVTALAASLAAALAAAALTGCAGPGAAARGAATPSAATPASPELRRFEVPGAAGPGALALELPVPSGWTAAAAPLLGEGSPLVVRLEPPGGRAQAVLSAIENPEPEEEVPAAEAARTFVLMARRKALGPEGEAKAPIEPLSAPGVEGFFFVASGPEGEPAVSPDAPEGARPYRNVLRGAAAVGRVLLTFTLLDDAPGPEREALLGMVRGARQVGPAGEPGAPGEPTPDGAEAAPGDGSGALRLEPDPGAATEPLSVEPPERPFTVLIDLPGFAMFRPRPAPASVGGAGWLVVGQDAGAGLVASVTVSDAPSAAADARACRDAALGRLRASGVEPGALALAEAGAAARASYALAEGSDAVGRHGHVFFARDGACVDVHVSSAGAGPATAERVEAILASVRFGERL